MREDISEQEKFQRMLETVATIQKFSDKSQNTQMIHWVVALIPIFLTILGSVYYFGGDSSATREKIETQALKTKDELMVEITNINKELSNLDKIIESELRSTDEIRKANTLRLDSLEGRVLKIENEK